MSTKQFKKFILKTHSWLGLLAGVLLSLVGISGSLYVFEPELNRWLCQKYFLTSGLHTIYQSDRDMAQDIELITQGRLESLQWPQRGRETFVFKLFGDERWHYFDHTTGQVSWGGSSFGSSVLDFILHFHTSLTLGQIGYYITATASLIFALFMLSTGLYLWYPRNKGRKKSSYSINWNASPKRRNYDIHNVTGFYFFLPLFLMGLTGAYFTYADQMQKVIDLVLLSEPAPASIWDLKSTAPEAKDQRLDICQALDRMAAHQNGFFKRNLWMTDAEDGALTFSYQRHRALRAGPDTRRFMRAHPYSGKILAHYDPEQLPRGAALAAKWLLPVHFGEFGGLFTRSLWFFAGWVPALLTWSGLKIWLGRGKRKRAKHGKLAVYAS